MTHFLTRLAPVGLALLASGALAAGPPAGVPHGPPSIPHGPPSIPHGPPVGIPSGPPAVATAHIPQGVATGRPANPGSAASSVGAAAKLLGKLNAAHASDTALEHASSKSVVGAIAVYKSDTVTAQADVAKYSDLVIQDQAAVDAGQLAVNTAQAALDAAKAAATPDQAVIDAAQTTLNTATANLATANQQLSADQVSLAAAQTGILDAQTALATSTNKTLTPATITSLNNLLGI